MSWMDHAYKGRSVAMLQRTEEPQVRLQGRIRIWFAAGTRLANVWLVIAQNR